MLGKLPWKSFSSWKQSLTVLITNTLRKAKMRLTSRRRRPCCNIVFRLRKSTRQSFFTPAIRSFIRCFLFMGWKARKATHLMYYINILKLPWNYLSFMMLAMFSIHSFQYDLQIKQMKSWSQSFPKTRKVILTRGGSTESCNGMGWFAMHMV